jgi:glycosyltransferase involved in cell wall biosynthesis
MLSPKVSVIIPVYNPYQERKERTVNSLVNQTVDDFEVIVIQDGFKTTISGQVESVPFQTHLVNNLDNDKVKFINLQDNYGPSVARNVGFQVSKGDIICYLDVGDEYSEGRIEHLIYMFEQNEQEGYEDIQLLIDSHNIIESTGVMTVFDHIRMVNHSNENKEQHIDKLQRYNISIPLAFAHTRIPFLMVGGFQPGIVCGEDGILLRRMANYLDHNQIVFTDFISGNYYVSENGQSRTQRRFDEGGFAFTNKHVQGSHGQYLDNDWFKNFHSKEWYE